MKPKDPDISAEEMRSLFSYESSTGQITRTSGDKRFFGTIAGYRHHTGYWMLKIGKRSILAQRVAWVLHYGEWPGELLVDHINGDKVDNRICNLRRANSQQNRANARKCSNKHGTRGVYFNTQQKSGRRWLSTITADGVDKYLGSFETKEEAAAAYRCAAIEIYGEFANIEQSS